MKKFYIDGSSWSKGWELDNPETDRWSKLFCDYYGAEEYNLGENAGCNRRIARNIINHDMKEYDFVIIQMAPNSRTEYFDGKVWKPAKPNTKWNEPHWQAYYGDIYTDEFGITDDEIYFRLFKEVLRDIPHLILSVDRGQSQTTIPIDMDISMKLDDRVSRHSVLKSWGLKPPFPYKEKYRSTTHAHPNKDGCKVIAQYLIDYVDNT